ncbi:hypothetical protein K469DRAFT_699572 [Zopfia rhizophila CBS 207.26]|uniref:Uncharacterized protein n=1 Tax=Zopfia rhizophila CBS 207.26 TaxID=1314779 RepID=A0A6A6EF64_9PEZI|nr:hypothetical protein K469DRAFT_701198 [Zopfia rhizophila CBS 207.26]KAF2189986.1 hypothetical protein K469DRAFT_699572 [Zopfia rhizophila CBS 207.26]
MLWYVVVDKAPHALQTGNDVPGGFVQMVERNLVDCFFELRRKPNMTVADIHRTRIGVFNTLWRVLYSEQTCLLLPFPHIDTVPYLLDSQLPNR